MFFYPMSHFYFTYNYSHILTTTHTPIVFCTHTPSLTQNSQP